MDIDISIINSAIAGAWQETVNAYAENCQTEIEAVKWQWDGTTLRRNGSIAGSPRDIYDTGDLFDSQTIEIDGDTATVSYDVDYAIDVHNGTEKTAARPWTETAAEDTDFSGIMGEALRKRLK